MCSRKSLVFLSPNLSLLLLSAPLPIILTSRTDHQGVRSTHQNGLKAVPLKVLMLKQSQAVGEARLLREALGAAPNTGFKSF